MTQPLPPLPCPREPGALPLTVRIVQIIWTPEFVNLKDETLDALNVVPVPLFTVTEV